MTATKDPTTRPEQVPEYVPKGTFVAEVAAAESRLAEFSIEFTCDKPGELRNVSDILEKTQGEHPLWISRVCSLEFLRGPNPIRCIYGSTRSGIEDTTRGKESSDSRWAQRRHCGHSSPPAHAGEKPCDHV